MMLALVISNAVWSVVAMFLYIEYSVHREQVGRLQAQRRSDDECRAKGMVFTPVIEGLWPDLDEKERLREQVRELESKGMVA